VLSPLINCISPAEDCYGYRSVAIAKYTVSAIAIAKPDSFVLVALLKVCKSYFDKNDKKVDDS
jgi:hypothetical protein